MPTFTAIALDRLLEPGASSTSVEKSANGPMPVPKPKPPLNPMPIANPKLERRHSTPTREKKVQRPQLTPSLYATPETTPVPDSPSSFPPSPYIINHKRRGPRLLKSFSEDDVSTCKKTEDVGVDDVNTSKIRADVIAPIKDTSVTFSISTDVEDNDNHNSRNYGEENGKGILEDGSGNGNNRLGGDDDLPASITQTPEREFETDDFYDPQESMSYTSNTEGEDTAERSMKPTPGGEFFDAWEELSSDGGAQSSLRNLEEELRGMRLSLLMEIEKRKQAEETLSKMQKHWQSIRQQLSVAGLTLPADLSLEHGQFDVDLADDLSQQFSVVRFVSEAIGRGTARAETEEEMEAVLGAKNFEIVRLLDRLHYYEAVNHEMSQRNQEAVETTRRLRQRRKRRQIFIWGSIAAVISLGTAALAWSYIQSEKSSDNNAPGNSNEAK